MNIKVGDRVRFKVEVYRGLGLRGGREIAVVESIEQIRNFAFLNLKSNGLHSYKHVVINNVEKVESKKLKRTPK